MQPRHSSAFTLVELLVVIGIIAVVAGGLNLAGHNGVRARALAASQNSVASLFKVAHAQAILHQSRATLVIDANPAAGGFLRTIYVALETGTGSEQWQVNDEGTTLSLGVFVVPGPDVLDGTEFAPAWPVARRSGLRMAAPGAISGILDNSGGRYLCLDVPLSATGGSEAEGGAKLVLGAGQRTPTTVRFDQPTHVRGLVVGNYGVTILINDASGLDF